MAASTREIKIGPLAIRFLVEGEESGGSVAVFEFDVPAGAKVPAAHSHDGYEETIFGLEGVLTWTLEGTPTDVGPGEALLISRGVVHQFHNIHDADAKALAIVTPGILGLCVPSARSRRSSARQLAAPGPRSDRRSDAPPRPHAGALTRNTIRCAKLWSCPSQPQPRWKRSASTSARRRRSPRSSA